MISMTSSGTEMRPASTFFLRMAQRVSKFGRLEVHVEAALEAASQPVGEVLELGDRTVAGEDHLLVGVVEGVEGMEELFLAAELVLEEVDVVDEEDIHVAVLVLEGLGGLVVDGLDELVGEFLGGDADDLGLGLSAARPGCRWTA